DGGRGFRLRVGAGARSAGASFHRQPHRRRLVPGRPHRPRIHLPAVRHDHLPRRLRRDITLGFPTPVYAFGVAVRETLGNGYVDSVRFLQPDGTYEGFLGGGGYHGDSDPTQPGLPEDNLIVTPCKTDNLVNGVEITVDTNHSSSYEEVDAVQLLGTLDRSWQ